MKTRVLVTGSNGQLGSAIKAQPPIENVELIYVDAVALDITELNEVDRFFEQNNLDYCINCAAYTAVDKAETAIALATNINATGVEYLVKVCKKYTVTLLHISTDFVFDGSFDTPYSEEALPKPINVYGDTKLKGERAIQDTFDTYFILRTSWLYSEFGNNFMKTMLRLGKERSELGIVSDQIGTPTYAGDLANVLLKIITTQSTAYGVYHYSNEGQCSWYEFAKTIFAESKMDIIINPIPTSVYPTPAKRPKYSVMDKSKIKKEMELTIPQWGTSLKKALKRLTN